MSTNKSIKFRAFEVSEAADKIFTGKIVEKDTAALPAGDVFIRVEYSSLNYKDALSASGSKGVTKNYPHTPGIDAAGTVAWVGKQPVSEQESGSSKISVGSKVLVTGHDLGMNTDGGFGQYIRVPAAWVAPCPKNLDLHTAMLFGTAGQTAAMCIDKLLRFGLDSGLKKEQGPVLVSGASGGVGILAVAILAKLGFQVTASTGKPAAHSLLKKLGASEVIDRKELSASEPRPMVKGRWAAAIDVAGGETLANIIKSLRYGASVAACGLVDSPKLETTVFPFILRGVNLLGIDSAEAPIRYKTQLWEKLSSEWMPAHLADIGQEITFVELPSALDTVLRGGATGRYVLNLQ